MLDDFSEAQEFGNAQPGPFSEREIDDKREKDDPWVMKDEGDEGIPADQVVPDDGNDECLDSENECDPASFFDLGGDKFFGQGNHDEERKDRDSSQTGAPVHAAQDEYSQDSQRDDRDRDSDAWQIEEAEFFHEETRECPYNDDAHKDSDTVLDAIGVKGQQGKRDDRRSIDAERLDPNHLAKESDQCDDNREHEEECYRLERHALFDNEVDERMILHIIQIYKTQNTKSKQNTKAQISKVTLMC